jgi:hypothetical protein
MLRVAVVVVTLAACAHRPPAEKPPPDVLVASAKKASRSGIEPVRFAQEFDRGADSTRVIQRFLEAVTRQGATYVSTMAIHLIVERDGAPVDCVTYIGPRSEIEGRSVAREGRTEDADVLKPVTRVITVHEQKCKTVRRRRTSSGSSSGSTYDKTRHGSRGGGTLQVAEYVVEQECRNIPRTRTVTTYQYQRESRWVAPTLDEISDRYALGPLVESEPVCGPLAPGRPTGNVIEGLIYVAP